jgi:DNA-binding MarR family transcriptional regulator
MAQSSLPSDPEIAGWLRTLGIASLCQWDVLVFLYRHQTTLLGAAHLARLLGYPSDSIVVALDVLESLDLVERSRVSQGARLYQFSISLSSPHSEAFARLQTLTSHRAGRIRVAQQLRLDRTHGETLQAAKNFLAEAQQNLRAARRRADELAERRKQWRRAI